MAEKGTTLPRIAALCAILAAIVGGMSAVLFLAAADWRSERVLRPALMVGAGSSGAQLLRWGALTDMLGYYLLLVPLFVCFPRELHRDRDGFAQVLGVAGVMYASFGALAAVVLATTAPSLMSAYERSDPGARDALELAFRTVTDAVATGVWQTLEIIPLGVWAIGTGLLVRARSRGLGFVGVGLGGTALTASAVRMLQPGSLPATTSSDSCSVVRLAVLGVRAMDRGLASARRNDELETLSFRVERTRPVMLPSLTHQSSSRGRWCTAHRCRQKES